MFYHYFTDSMYNNISLSLKNCHQWASCKKVKHWINPSWNCEISVTRCNFWVVCPDFLSFFLFSSVSWSVLFSPFLCLVPFLLVSLLSRGLIPLSLCPSLCPCLYLGVLFPASLHPCLYLCFYPPFLFFFTSFPCLFLFLLFSIFFSLFPFPWFFIFSFVPLKIKINK